jgi:5'-nucleotidase
VKVDPVQSRFYPEPLQKGPVGVLILLTNDDGIHAPGLAAMESQLARLGEVVVVAPATEQSGVGHSITYLTPLTAKEVYVGQKRWGWAVDGSPADCVKLGVTEFCPRRPDLLVSGINGGLNAGINVLYSGTVAAAIEGAFFGITSVAVSLEYDEHAQFDKAAQVAGSIIRQILQMKEHGPQLYNMNIPTAALAGRPRVKAVAMDVAQYGEQYEKRIDPFGRAYYWATAYPCPSADGSETDLSTMADGYVTLTPLDYNMTQKATLAKMRDWQFRLDEPDGAGDVEETADRQPRVVRSERKKLPVGE